MGEKDSKLSGVGHRHLTRLVRGTTHTQGITYHVSFFSIGGALLPCGNLICCRRFPAAALSPHTLSCKCRKSIMSLWGNSYLNLELGNSREKGSKGHT